MNKPKLTERCPYCGSPFEVIWGDYDEFYTSCCGIELEMYE
jgi:endogenous inhibitor of DNA gyrase (YacG/DUF329 family)